MGDVLILNSDGMPLSMMPLSVVGWQTAIRLLFLNKIIVIKDHDNWVVRSPSITIKVPSIAMTTDYIKWSRTVKYNRNNVLLRDGFKCQLQSTPTCRKHHGKGHSPSDLTIDHVIPKSHGGKTNWKNVTTSCKECNFRKGNDSKIIPKQTPTRPSYYELAAKRKRFPIRIRDKAWKAYLDWPEEMIQTMETP